jgi:single-strand DNA-binding protein
MSNLKNSVQLIGHLGIDPEVKVVENGNKVARFRMATTESYKNKNGNWQDETTWHSIVAWESLAERIEQQLTKGAYILLEGKLNNRNYVDSKGDKKYVYEVRATNFLLLDKKQTSPKEQSAGAENEEMPF